MQLLRTKPLKTCFLDKIFRWKKIVKKLTKSWKLKKSILNAFSDISWTSWATETRLTFSERIFHNKRLCKSPKSSKTIFYNCYCQKYQFAFFCTSLYEWSLNTPWIFLRLGPWLRKSRGNWPPSSLVDTLEFFYHYNKGEIF